MAIAAGGRALFLELLLALLLELLLALFQN
jgi:hypothetical protein